MKATKANLAAVFIVFTAFMALLIVLPWDFLTFDLELTQLILAKVIMQCTKIILVVIWSTILFLFLVFMFHKEKE